MPEPAEALRMRFRGAKVRKRHHGYSAFFHAGRLLEHAKAAPERSGFQQRCTDPSVRRRGAYQVIQQEMDLIAIVVEHPVQAKATHQFGHIHL